jgi:2-methylcitrate dehydratase PrpD
MSRPFGIGVAARNGVTSALLAQKGFGGPEVLEGKYTIFNAFSGEEHYDSLLEELGTRFEVMNLAFKRHSSCSFTHPALDALLKIREEKNLDPDEIEKVNVRFPSRGATLINRAISKSHNMQYVLSVAAYKNGVYSDDILFEQKDPRIWALSEKVDVIFDNELDQFFPTVMSTIIEVETKTGESYTKRVDYAKGSPENPMTREEIREKFLRLATTRIDEEQGRKIIEEINDFEKIKKITDLTELLMTDEV